jgi:hypothetical protein
MRMHYVRFQFIQLQLHCRDFSTKQINRSMLRPQSVFAQPELKVSTRMAVCANNVRAN